MWVYGSYMLYIPEFPYTKFMRSVFPKMFSHMTVDRLKVTLGGFVDRKLLVDRSVLIALAAVPRWLSVLPFNSAVANGDVHRVQNSDFYNSI